MKRAAIGMTMQMFQLSPRRKMPEACAVPCSTCGAAPGQRCLYPPGVYSSDAHPARVRSYSEASSQFKILRRAKP
jgi:hypothetical protein